MDMGGNHCHPHVEGQVTSSWSSHQCGWEMNYELKGVTSMTFTHCSPLFSSPCACISAEEISFDLLFVCLFVFREDMMLSFVG